MCGWWYGTSLTNTKIEIRPVYYDTKHGALKLLDTSMIFLWQYHEVSRNCQKINQSKYINQVTL